MRNKSNYINAIRLLVVSFLIGYLVSFILGNLLNNTSIGSKLALVFGIGIYLIGVSVFIKGTII